MNKFAFISAVGLILSVQLCQGWPDDGDKTEEALERGSATLPVSCLHHCRNSGHENGKSCRCKKAAPQRITSSETKTNNGSSMRRFETDNFMSLGCYRADFMSLPLQAYKKLNIPFSKCMYKCRSLGYIYAGVFEGKVCMCGNQHIHYRYKTLESDCDYTCERDDWNCGGHGAFNLYRVNECSHRDILKYHKYPVYLGCYADEWRRHLDAKFTSSVFMTLEKCFEACRAERYMFAATEAGNQCFCGNNEQKLEDRRDSENCDFRCRGDKGETCGGWWHMSLYAVGICRE